MSCDFSKKHCVPCTEGTLPLKGEVLKKLFKNVDTGWKIINQHHLEKIFYFKDWIEAITFTNQLGKIAEEEGHHPDVFLSYGKVVVQLWTHKIDGLSESDFILAAKYDKIPSVVTH